MLRDLMEGAGAELWLKTSVTAVRHENDIFTLDIVKGERAETLTCKKSRPCHGRQIHSENGGHGLCL